MKMGCGKRELVFPSGFFPTEGFVEQVHPLYVRAMMIGEKAPFVLVSIEMTSLPDEEVEALKGTVEEVTGISPDRIWITVTHTFSAPHIMPDGALKTEEERAHKKTLQNLLKEAVASAAAEAKENILSAELTVHQGESLVVQSRDIELPEGWWIGCGGTGPSDRTLTVLRFRENGEDRGMILHLNVQSSVLDGTGAAKGRCVSSDLAGLACAELESNHPGMTVLFLIGAAGDQAPVEKGNGYMPDGQGGWAEKDLREAGVPIAERLGKQLAGETEAVLAAEGRTIQEEEADIFNAEVLVPTKQMNRNLRELKPVRYCEWALEPEKEQPISILRIGELAIVGVKPELTWKTDQTMKKKSPLPCTLMATLVNGGAKYMAERGAYEKCMYEAINSPFGPGAAERLAQSALTMLEGICRE